MCVFRNSQYAPWLPGGGTGHFFACSPSRPPPPPSSIPLLGNRHLCAKCAPHSSLVKPIKKNRNQKNGTHISMKRASFSPPSFFYSVPPDTRYFAVSGKPLEHGAMLQKWGEAGYRGERDLFLCRAVLYTLSFNRTADADELWASMTAAAAQAEGAEEGGGRGEWLDTPLCCFTRFLLELAGAKAAGTRKVTPEIINAFHDLKKKYKPSLDRDPYLHQVE
ncbi:unnamed protein product [Discosporangium mesarthrocarpum]